VFSRRAKKLGSLTIELSDVEQDPTALRQAMIDGIRQMGIASLPWDRETNGLRLRSEWLRTNATVGAAWPDLSDGHLLATLDDWLAPFLEGISSRSQLGRLNLQAALKSLFAFSQLKELDRLAPATLESPAGTRLHLEYSAARQPVLPVRLQEMFGQLETPRVAGGTVPVTLHLLSPAGRPLAVTQDLPSFWKDA
jgi:ATP-dependent helicase HrpB